tara:strand:- start:283 stop:441 length:159 start_codon:yes stop_codon:yes gene_type:complete
MNYVSNQKVKNAQKQSQSLNRWVLPNVMEIIIFYQGSVLDAHLDIDVSQKQL